ncbi:MAG: efflux RND transporter periplasmic adaptor subunit, partial [Syntrophobacteraceae bacterium]|nr:efflux RND transporter periplasmic adaptor subunit [Syntrophobacteraceae bacterium]
MTSDSNSLSHSDESQGTNRFEGHGPATGYRILRGEVGLRLFLRQVLLLTLSVITIAGCSGDATGQKKGNDARQRPVVPVTVTTSVEKAVPVQLRAIGKVQAFSTVTIKSQVAGQIVSVHFREGQEVKQGDLLFTIDPRPFEANVKKAEAQLAKDRAQLQNAKKLIERYQAVVKRGYVSEEQYDTALANLAALESTVRAGEAAVESARLELKYCTIHSPIGGYTGEVKVHQGNIMKENDNDRPMVTINQVSPIHVSFSVP